MSFLHKTRFIKTSFLLVLVASLLSPPVSFAAKRGTEEMDKALSDTPALKASPRTPDGSGERTEPLPWHKLPQKPRIISVALQAREGKESTLK